MTYARKGGAPFLAQEPEVDRADGEGWISAVQLGDRQQVWCGELAVT